MLVLALWTKPVRRRVQRLSVEEVQSLNPWSPHPCMVLNDDHSNEVEVSMVIKGFWVSD